MLGAPGAHTDHRGDALFWLWALQRLPELCLAQGAGRGAEHPSCLALGWGHSQRPSSRCSWGKVCRDAAATSSYGEHPVVLVTVGASGSRCLAPPSAGALWPLLAMGRVPPGAETFGDAACSSGEPGAGGVMRRLEMTPSLEGQQQAQGDVTCTTTGRGQAWWQGAFAGQSDASQAVP